MNNDTDSTVSSTPSSKRKRKFQKKNKLEKKSKKHKKDKKKRSRKEKKRSRKESSSSEDESKRKELKPIVPSRSLDHIKTTTTTTICDGNLFGPALPPHLLNIAKKEDIAKPILVIGPTIPDSVEDYAPREDNEVSKKSELDISNKSEEEEEDLRGSYGPLPLAEGNEMTDAQIELEKRALELKMAAIDGSTADNIDQTVREEWMLKLPDVGLKDGLAALSNIKRGFYQGKDRPDFTDRSSWTKTPQSANDPQTNPEIIKTSKEDLQSHALALYEKQRDAEQEALAKKHKKKHKRDQSLVEMHQKKLRKEEKRKAKELKERGEKPERRPFSRDIDLKLNKIDSNQTKQIVDKAKILNSKFSSGQAKYL